MPRRRDRRPLLIYCSMLMLKRLPGFGLLTAFAASLCCITPVLAAVAGLAGLGASVAWLDPARPYLVGATVLALGFAWYQKLRPAGSADPDCACDDDERPSFWQSRSFLAVTTALALLLLAFPLYSAVLFPAPAASTTSPSTSELTRMNFAVSGMTCTGCEQHVRSEVGELPGIISVDVSYERANAIVAFDDAAVSVAQITKAINRTGYRVIGVEELSEGSK